MDLQVDQVALEVVFVVGSMVEEEEEVSEEGSKIEVASAVAVAGEVLDIKEAEAFLEVALEETVVGMEVLTEARTGTAHLLLMLQLVREAVVVEGLAAAEVDMAALDHQIEMVLQLVGMIRAEVDAPTTIEMAHIVAAEEAATEAMIAMDLLVAVVVATWSR